MKVNRQRETFKLSTRKFKDVVARAGRPEKNPNIVINFADVVGKIPDNDIFDFCRDVFNKKFHFGNNGNGYNVKEYTHVVACMGTEMYGSMTPNGHNAGIIIDSLDLIGDDKDQKRFQKKLEQSTKFQKGKI